MASFTLPRVGAFVFLSLFGVLLYLVFAGEPAPAIPQELLATVASEHGNSSLTVDVVREGTGEEVGDGDLVLVYYIGRLENGMIFDERTSGEEFAFIIGGGEVIDGWDLGVSGMRVGEVRRLTIPSDLAYGEEGIPGLIPGNTTLVFEVELRGRILPQ